MQQILILGGGAAGLAAALAAAQTAEGRAHITVLDKNAKVGKKLLATGNGRCNLDNRDITPERYFTSSPKALRRLLSAVDEAAPLAWFECFQQIFIQIMSNIDSADKDISVFVKAKQRCVRNVSVRIPFLYFKVLKIIIKIVKIIAEYCIGGRICAVVFNIRFPFGQHFKQLFAVLRREPNKFNIHN